MLFWARKNPGQADQTVAASNTDPVPVTPTTGDGTAMVQGLTRQQLDAAAVKTEPLGRLGLAYEITAAATASASLALSAGVTRIRVSARNANCRIAIGTGTQTATNTSGAATSHFVADGTSMDVACLPGSSISVIRGADQTTNGVVHVSELI